MRLGTESGGVRSSTLLYDWNAFCVWLDIYVAHLGVESKDVRSLAICMLGIILILDCLLCMLEYIYNERVLALSLGMFDPRQFALNL